MKESKKKIAVLGATGLVGRYLCNLIVEHPQLELAAVVGSHRSVNQSFHGIWEQKELILSEHYGKKFWHKTKMSDLLYQYTVSSVEELAQRSDIDLVMSSVPLSAAGTENLLLSKGFTLVSNSPHERLASNTPLIISEVNVDKIYNSHFIKCPNCITVGLGIILNIIS